MEEDSGIALLRRCKPLGLKAPSSAQHAFGRRRRREGRKGRSPESELDLPFPLSLSQRLLSQTSLVLTGTDSCVSLCLLVFLD